jgi:hypothetical protein
VIQSLCGSLPSLPAFFFPTNASLHPFLYTSCLLSPIPPWSHSRFRPVPSHSISMDGRATSSRTRGSFIIQLQATSCLYLRKLGEGCRGQKGLMSLSKRGWDSSVYRLIARSGGRSSVVHRILPHAGGKTERRTPKGMDGRFEWKMRIDEMLEWRIMPGVLPMFEWSLSRRSMARSIGHPRRIRAFTRKPSRCLFGRLP